MFQIGRPLTVVVAEGEYRLAEVGALHPAEGAGPADLPVAAFVPACPLRSLGSIEFRNDLGLEYAYVAGAMAGGISSVEMVETLGRAGMLGIFGAGGLTPDEVEKAVDRLSRSLGHRPWGANLIHSPGEPELEAAVADLYLRRGVRLVEASAYMDLTLPLVRYRVAGLHRDPSGRVVAPNRVIAKASRVEVAARFFSPPPERFLRELRNSGFITDEQAGLAAAVPMAQDLTAEADSGGHTDNRPALTLLPIMLGLRDRMQAEHGYEQKLRVGAAGGIATPLSALAALAMGADYVLTGSINQAARESGASDAVREMLARAGPADVTMAPAADMFEMGVKVQVLKWGTMFPMRAARLYELYRTCGRLEDLPPAERENLEKNVFRLPLDRVWEETRAYFQVRDRRQVERAETDPKHKMALVFRWYLGQAAHWAVQGLPERKMDYQVYCGPAMGAFNEWAAGSHLADWRNRRVVELAMNILYGAAVHTRFYHLRLQGVALPPEMTGVRPLSLEQIEELTR
ncbi:MAG: PfaD family polyunsaturated fatty acid/polyketide biosynthesis protein [Thermodesulfobacteriota bacterium]